MRKTVCGFSILSALSVLSLLSVHAAPIPFLPIDPLAREKKAFDAGKYAEVTRNLSPEAMQKLEGETLARAYLYLAKSWENLGRLDKALGVYQVAVKLYPDHVALLSGLAWLLHRSGLEEEATPLFDKILRTRPDDAAAHRGLAEIDAALGLWNDSALHYAAALKSQKDDGNLFRNYADALLHSRDYAEAEAAARKALALIPGDPESILEIAAIQRASGKLDDALTTLERLAAGEDAQSPRKLLRGLWLLEARRAREAEALGSAALKINPLNPTALWIRAEARLSLGQRSAARQDLKTLAAQEDAAPFAARAARKLLELPR